MVSFRTGLGFSRVPHKGLCQTGCRSPIKFESKLSNFLLKQYRRQACDMHGYKYENNPEYPTEKAFYATFL